MRSPRKLVAPLVAVHVALYLAVLVWDEPPHANEAVLFGIASGQVSLLAVWWGFGITRVASRLTATAAVIAVWAWLSNVGLFDDEWWGLKVTAVMLSAEAIGVVSFMLVFQRLGFQLVNAKIHTLRGTHHSSRLPQFSLRTLLVYVALAAAVLAVLRRFDLFSFFEQPAMAYSGGWALVGSVAAVAALANKPGRVALMLLCPTVVAVALLSGYFGSGSPPSYSFDLILSGLHAAIVFASLSVLRASGFRFTRRSTSQTMDPLTVALDDEADGV